MKKRPTQRAPDPAKNVRAGCQPLDIEILYQ